MAKSNTTSQSRCLASNCIATSKVSIGTLLMLIFPNRRRRMEKLATIPWHSDQAPDAIDRLIRSSLLWWRSRDTSGNKLASLHQEFWREQSANDYYLGTTSRFEKVFLPNFDHFLDSVSAAMVKYNLKHVVEIGCGDGQLLRHMKQRVPAKRYIGIDLSEDQIAKNRERDTELGLEYHCGDAAQWIASSSPSNSLYVTGLGVLEYFTQSQLEGLLQTITDNSSPACALFIEPIDIHANLSEFNESYVAGEEHSFTHHYPNRLQECGWTILHTEEILLTPYRWIVVTASSDGMPTE